MYGNSRVIKRINKIDYGEPLSTQAVSKPLGLAGEDNNEEKAAVLLPSPVANPTTSFFNSPSEPRASSNFGTGRMFQVFSTGAASVVGGALQNGGAKMLLEELNNAKNVGIFRANISTFLDNVSRAFKNRKWTELEINGVKIFQNLHPFEEDQLGSAMQASGYEFDPEMTDAAIVIARQQNCRNATEFVECVQNLREYVTDNAPTPVVRGLLINDLKNAKSQSFQDLASKFQLNNTKEAAAPFALTYHFYRYTDTTRELTQFEEHLKICRELFGDEVNSNNAIFSETASDTVTVTYVDERDTIYSVVIQHIPHENDITYFMATVSILKE